MNPLTYVLIGLALALVALVLIILFRTLDFPVERAEVAPAALPAVDGKSVAERIGLAVQYKTIAYPEQEKIDGSQFKGLHQLFETLYPQLHSQLKRELINDYSLLYTWQGSNPDLDPILFMAHQDVVPADESPDSGWEHPPFSGEIADGYVWGRGTQDIKDVVICLLEAASELLKEGFQPTRTIYLAFGHDEEVSGNHGARAISDMLKERGVQLSFVLDEGGSIMDNFVDGVDAPVAMIGISEKGYLSLKLQTDVPGGHSAMPPENTAIGLLALAVAALEANQFPSRLEVLQFMMSYLGKEVPFMQRMALANTWLFGNMLKKKLLKSPTTAASMRTTTSPTIFHAGQAENVLPAKAEAIVNFRLMPGDTIKDVYERVRSVIGDDLVTLAPAKGETLESEYGWNPTPVSPTDSAQFERLDAIIRSVFPGVLTAPFLVTGATDARYYARICSNTFRFSPVLMTKADLAGVHGKNERLSFENAGRMVGFFIECMREISSMGAEADMPPVELIEQVDLPEFEPEPELVVKPMKKD